MQKKLLKSINDENFIKASAQKSIISLDVIREWGVRWK